MGNILTSQVLSEVIAGLPVCTLVLHCSCFLSFFYELLENVISEINVTTNRQCGSSIYKHSITVWKANTIQSTNNQAKGDVLGSFLIMGQLVEAVYAAIVECRQICTRTMTRLSDTHHCIKSNSILLLNPD